MFCLDGSWLSNAGACRDPCSAVQQLDNIAMAEFGRFPTVCCGVALNEDLTSYLWSEGYRAASVVLAMIWWRGGDYGG